MLRRKKESFENRRRRLAKGDAYRTLFEHLPDCLLIYDQEARVVDATVGALELFGYTRAELGELELGDLYPQEGGRVLREALKSVFSSRVSRFEIRCRKKNGELFPAEISASRCLAGGENMIQVLVRDVGQTVRIVRCLRENDEITRSILSCALDAIISVDVTGDVLEFNPAAEKMFGYSRAEAVGCAAADLIVPHELRERYHAVLRRCVAGKGQDWLGRRLEGLVMRRDGETFPVELRVGQVRRGDKQTFTAYLSDISERKQAVSRLAEEKDKLAAILSATSDGMVLLDGSGSVLYANRSFEEMVGCSAEVICGASAADLVARLMRLDPDPADAFEFALGVGAVARQTEQPLFRRCRISGDVKRTLRVSWLALGSQTDGRYGRLAVFRDVTWEDEAHRAKDDLIGNVSHELRTPLTSIQGFVQLISEEKVGPVSARQHKVLGIIGENVERLKQLVGDLLDVDRVATDSLSLDAFELDCLLREILANEQPRAARKGLELALDCPAAAEIVGDRERLYQVFQNLIANSIKYTREGRVAVDVRVTDTHAVVEVRDTGVGISEAELPRIFERFFRSSCEYATKVGGTGLGLSIVKALVERHGGEIEIESEIDVGTCFRVILPRKPAEDGLCAGPGAGHPAAVSA